MRLKFTIAALALLLGSGSLSELVAAPSTLSGGAVFPPDNRTRNALTTVHPGYHIGRLENGCTGSLVGSNLRGGAKYVLTAAHCVFDPVTKKLRTGLGFVPQQNGAVKPLGTVQPVKVFVPKAWSMKGDRAADYALLVLSRDLRPLAIAFHLWSGQYPRGITGLLAYPSDKPTGTMWASACSYEFYQVKYLRYKCDAAKGSDGAPFWSMEFLGQIPMLTGIHLGGPEGGYNIGLWITPPIFEQLRSWIQATND
ncbi:MAG: trypsin-like peptidase domain-containing protein [Geminicoccaceae bacterium]